MINIVYSSTDSYSEICGVSLTSCLENNKSEDMINVFIIDNDISQANKEKLLELTNSYKRKLTFVPKINLEKITDSSIYTGRWNIGTFFRLFLASLLPNDVERVIYIDCDIIVRHSLTSVYNLDLGDCLMAGCDDFRSGLYRVEIGCSENDVYVNNGFLVIDLKRWRECLLEKEFIDYIRKQNGNITYMDQGVSNAILSPKNLIKEIPPIYNSQRVFFDFNYQELMKLRRPSRFCSESEFNEAVSDPTVVHFTPVFISGTRPWQIKDKHPFTPEYRMYKNMSPWKEEPYRKDDRKFGKKLMTIIARMMPRKLMIKIFSYLHSTWYPKKRMKSHNKTNW